MGLIKKAQIGIDVLTGLFKVQQDGANVWRDFPGGSPNGGESPVIVSDTDPGATGAGTLWINTSTDPAVMSLRNGANTQWASIGMLNIQFLGTDQGVAGATFFRFAPFGGGFTIEGDGSKINVDTPLDMQGFGITNVGSLDTGDGSIEAGTGSVSAGTVNVDDTIDVAGDDVQINSTGIVLGANGSLTAGDIVVNDNGDLLTAGGDVRTAGGEISTAYRLKTPVIVPFNGVDGVSIGTPESPLGFYGESPQSKPTVPLTTPDVQDVIDALVAVGLVTQSD